MDFANQHQCNKLEGAIYAVRPWEWKDGFPKADLASAETRTELFKRWNDPFGETWKTIS